MPIIRLGFGPAGPRVEADPPDPRDTFIMLLEVAERLRLRIDARLEELAQAERAAKPPRRRAKA